jgi:non-ribosomal peptide synthetase component F
LDALEVPALDLAALAEDAGRTGRLPMGSPEVAVDADHLAYIMYTSGSTGQPKGVAMRHGPLASLIAWHWDHPILGRGGRTLQFSSLSFDVSFQEIFSTWATGGELVLVDQETRQDPHALAGFIREQGIQRLFLPNVALQQLAGVLAGAPGQLALKEVITAGEQLRITGDLWRLAARCEGFTLHNHYGPTEAHVVSHHILGGDARDWPALPPIGRPLPGARLYVLDRCGQPVPAGVAGELAIGAACWPRATWADRISPRSASCRTPLRGSREGGCT